MIAGQCAAIVHRHPDKATEFYIDHAGVADACLRRGIAGRLMDAMLALGAERAAGRHGLEPSRPAGGTHHVCLGPLRRTELRRTPGVCLSLTEFGAQTALSPTRKRQSCPAAKTET